MNKHEKIKYLQDAGLNTTRLCLLVKGDESCWNKAVDFINENGGASIRTFSSDESILSPHKPNLEKEAAIKEARMLMHDYNVILTERVNPAFAIASGKANIVKKEGTMRPEMSFEFSMGPGAVVRDVDKKAPSELLNFTLLSAMEIEKLAPSFKDLSFKLKDGSDWKFIDLTLDQFCEGVKTACIEMIGTKMENHTFELSIYSKPIGVKNRPVIFWEVYQIGNLTKV
jgi:hypothetical protein